MLGSPSRYTSGSSGCSGLRTNVVASRVCIARTGIADAGMVAAGPSRVLRKSVGDAEDRKLDRHLACARVAGVASRGRPLSADRTALVESIDRMSSVRDAEDDEGDRARLGGTCTSGRRRSTFQALAEPPATSRAIGGGGPTPSR